jgi:hypothetical protein
LASRESWTWLTRASLRISHSSVRFPGFLSRYCPTLSLMNEQFGINGDPNIQSQWNSRIYDDPSLGIPFYKGMVAFAGNGDNSRTTQVCSQSIFNSRVFLKLTLLLRESCSVSCALTRVDLLHSWKPVLLGTLAVGDRAGLCDPGNNLSHRSRVHWIW